MSDPRDRELGILRIAVRALGGGDAAEQDEMGGCVHCGASGPRSSIDSPRYRDHSADCAWKLARDAIEQTSDPDWLLGVRADEAKRFVAIANRMSADGEWVEWIELYHGRGRGKKAEREIPDRQTQLKLDGSWEAFARLAEIERLISVTAELTGSGQRFRISRLLEHLDGAPA